MIKVLLADDTEIAKTGLRTILEIPNDIEVIGEADSTLEAENQAKELKPDVLIMDLKWFGDETAGQTAIRRIKSSNPRIKIIAVTAYSHLIADARRSGADAALTKEFKSDALFKIIRELFVQEEIKENYFEIGSIFENLTLRELEVLKLLSQGNQDKEIAKSLSISVYTVKNHVRNILSKLDAKNRTEAARKSQEYGLY